MVKQSLADTVATSMNELMEDDEYLRIFAKKSKKCCDCTKCGKTCPCKKCKKSCQCAMTKKAAKACCECPEKCTKDCPCKKCHEDCSMCQDMSAAANQIITDLLALSEKQEEMGLAKSAAETLQTVAGMLDELKRISDKKDSNEVSIEELMTPAEIEKSVDLDAPNLYTSKKESEPYESLEQELSEIDPVEELIVSENPKQYSSLKDNPELVKLLLQDPQLQEEMRSKVKNIVSVDPVTDVDSLLHLSETELAPPSEEDVKLPAPAKTPPTEQELSEKFEDELRHGKKNPYYMYGEPALPNKLTPEEANKATVISKANQELDVLIQKMGGVKIASFTPEQKEAILELCDEYNDGLLTKEEFVSSIRIVMSAPEIEDLSTQPYIDTIGEEVDFNSLANLSEEFTKEAINWSDIQIEDKQYSPEVKNIDWAKKREPVRLSDGRYLDLENTKDPKDFFVNFDELQDLENAVLKHQVDVDPDQLIPNYDDEDGESVEEGVPFEEEEPLTFDDLFQPEEELPRLEE